LRFKALLVSLCVCVSSVAPAYAASSRGTSAGSDAVVLGRQLVDDLFVRYKSFSRSAFEQELSFQFSPSRQEFLDRAQRNAYSGVILGLEYSLQRALLKKNTLTVRIAWDKTVQPFGNTAPVNSRGAATLVFRKQDDRWLLLRVTGESPF
jgi:hypothetical protein